MVSPTPSLIKIQSLVLLRLGTLAQEVGELLVRNLLVALVVPEVGSVVAVGVLQRVEAGLDGVAQSAGVTTRARVHIINTCEGDELLHRGRSDDARTTRSGDQTHTDGTALASHLDGHGVHLTGVVTPVATTHGDDRHLGDEDGTLDGSGDFLGALGTETNVSVAVTDSHESLEAGSLTGSGLLLDGEHLHDFLLQLREKHVHDLGLLDGEGEEVDLLDGGDLAELHQTTKLGHGHPFLGLLHVAAGASSLTTTATRAALLLGGSSSGGFSSGSFNRDFRNYTVTFKREPATFRHNKLLRANNV